MMVRESKRKVKKKWMAKKKARIKQPIPISPIYPTYALD
jgi:hypothetical protein